MRDKRGLITEIILAVVAGLLLLLTHSAGAQDPRTSPAVRSGNADVFSASKAEPSSKSLADQPEHGR
jgi:hypothetical protein